MIREVGLISILLGSAGCAHRDDESAIARASVDLAKSLEQIEEPTIVEGLGLDGSYKRKAIDDGYGSYRYDATDAGVIKSVVVDNLPHYSLGASSQQQAVRIVFAQGPCITAKNIQDASQVTPEINRNVVIVHGKTASDIKLEPSIDGLRFVLLKTPFHYGEITISDGAACADGLKIFRYELPVTK